MRKFKENSAFKPFNFNVNMTANQYDPLKYYSKSELASMANVSYSTFYRYLKSRRKIFTQLGISIYAKKLPPQAVHYICNDYSIDI